MYKWWIIINRHIQLLMAVKKIPVSFYLYVTGLFIPEFWISRFTPCIFFGLSIWWTVAWETWWRGVRECFQGSFHEMYISCFRPHARGPSLWEDLNSHCLDCCGRSRWSVGRSGGAEETLYKVWIWGSMCYFLWRCNWSWKSRMLQIVVEWICICRRRIIHLCRSINTLID